MKVSLALVAASATLAAAVSCVPIRPAYLRVPMASVTLECTDGYMVYNDTDAKTILVTPYLATEAYRRLCGKGAPPLSVRARQAAEKQLGTSCHILSEGEPWPLNFEFAYVCQAPPPKPPKPIR